MAKKKCTFYIVFSLNANPSNIIPMVSRVQSFRHIVYYYNRYTNMKTSVRVLDKNIVVARQRKSSRITETDDYGSRTGIK